jgi:hypothetical protein
MHDCNDALFGNIKEKMSFTCLVVNGRFAPFRAAMLTREFLPLFLWRETLATPGNIETKLCAGNLN